jgi:hypothetical protein
MELLFAIIGTVLLAAGDVHFTWLILKMWRKRDLALVRAR